MTELAFARIPPNGERTAAATLSRRYQLFMAGTGLVDLLFSGAYFAVAGSSPASWATVVLPLAILMAASAAAGARLFAPVQAALSAGASARRAYRRLNRLPLYSGLCVFGIGFGYAAWVFSSGAYIADSAAVDQLSPSYKANALVWYALVYATYFSLYATFAANDCARRARRALAALGPQQSPREGDLPGHLVPRLWLALAMLAILPPLVIVMDLTAFSPLRRAQGLSTEQVIVLDLIATLAAGGLAAVFAARQISAPLAQLMAAVGRVAAGRYGEPAQVLGDDELGRLTLAFNRMSEGLREREVIRREFGRYVSPAIASRILSDALETPSDGAQPSGRPRELRETTILFSDLQGFTTLAEQLPPQEMVTLMNHYFRLIDETVRSHGGMVHSFIGDAVHASFNFAEECADHASAAIATAIDIQRRLRNAQFAGGRSMPTRIGIHTGPVAAAAVGSEERLNYAMFGDAVNVAMRLEQLNKVHNTRVLASAETIAARSSSAPDAGIVLRPLGDTPLRGRLGAVTIFEIREAA